MLVMLSVGFSMVASFPSYAHDALNCSYGSHRARFRTYCPVGQQFVLCLAAPLVKSSLRNLWCS